MSIFALNQHCPFENVHTRQPFAIQSGLAHLAQHAEKLGLADEL